MSDTGIRLVTPVPLLEFARQRRLVLFLGAGFSKNISPNIPDASKLISIAASHAKFDERLLAIHASNDYMLVAEYLEHQRTLDNVIVDLASRIHDTKYMVRDSRPHIQVTEIDTSSIFTTNWDNWIERAFDHRHKPYKIIRDIADLVSPQDADGSAVKKRSRTGSKKVYRTPLIVKYHGDISNTSSIVFSIRAYFDRIIERNALDSLLESELYTKSFLFIGYSFSDPNLRLILYRLLRQKRNSKAKFPPSFIVTNGDNPIVHAWMTHLGISPINVDSAPEKLKPSVEKLLDDIIGAQQ